MHQQLTQSELDSKLALHKLWWDSRGEKGETLSLPSSNLSYLSFKNAELRGANLVACTLIGADLQGVQLESINISESNLCGANLAGGNLKRCDFRYVQIDEQTNFDGADTTGMIIDPFTVTLLPNSVDITTLQLVVDKNRFDICFYFEDEYKEIGLETVQTLLQTLQHKNQEMNLSTEIAEKGNRVNCTIKAENPEDKEKAKEDFEQLGLALLGDKNMLTQVLPDPIQQLRFKGKVERLLLDYKQSQEIRGLEQQRMAELHNELIMQKRVNQDIKQEFNQFLQNFSGQLPVQNSLSVSMMINITDTRGAERKVNAKNVLYCEKTKEEIVLYLKNKETLETEGTMGGLIQRLQQINPAIFQGHKNFAFNMDYASKYERDKNNILVSLHDCETQIIVSQNHIKAFKALWVQKKDK